VNTLKEIKERFDAWSLEEEKNEDWRHKLDVVLQNVDHHQALLDLVGDVGEDDELAEQMLTAVIRALPDDAINSGVDYLYRYYGKPKNGRSIDAEEVQEERLSATEIKKRKTRRVFGKAPEDDAAIPDELRALANGVVGNRSDKEQPKKKTNPTPGNMCHSKRDGSFSDCEDVGSASLPGLGQHARSKRSVGKDTSKCGRKDLKTYCHDGKPRR
jgi:hypothetical protein